MNGVFRTVLFVLVLAATTALWGLQVIVAAYLGVKARPGGVYERVSKRWCRVNLWAAGIPVTQQCRDVVPAGSVIYVANHSSIFDAMALAGNLPGRPRFVARKEIYSLPIFGRALAAMGHVYIDRENRQAAFRAYDHAIEIIQAGNSAVVFPEGTRSRTGDILPFKKGPFVLAIAAQRPIVPVYVSNTYQILPKGRWLLRPHPIVMRYGAPMSTDGLAYEDRDPLSNRVRREMLALKARVDADDPPN